jgi:hypothetical protein
VGAIVARRQNSAWFYRVGLHELPHLDGQAGKFQKRCVPEEKPPERAAAACDGQGRRI